MTVSLVQSLLKFNIYKEPKHIIVDSTHYFTACQWIVKNYYILEEAMIVLM
jgi:hypothetical protein